MHKILICSVMRAARRLPAARNEYLFDEGRKAAVREGSFAITVNTGYIWISRGAAMRVFKDTFLYGAR